MASLPVRDGKVVIGKIQSHGQDCESRVQGRAKAYLAIISGVGVQPKETRGGLLSKIGLVI